jgi:tRNA A37 N6-isopentenylltransferase MiaA
MPETTTTTSSTTTTTKALPSQQQQQVLSVEVLRVAQQELSAGNQKGQVFLQLSPGAVAVAIDRPVLKARVDRRLHDAIEKEQSS